MSYIVFLPDVYFDDISEFEKDKCFIESVDDITPVDALLRALSSENAVVYADNRSTPLVVLPRLQKLTSIRFKKSTYRVITLTHFGAIMS